MNRWKLFLLVTSFALFVFACGQTANSPVAKNDAPKTNQAATPAPAASVDDVAMSTELYTKNCMTCHRDSGKGGKVTVDGKSLDPNDLTATKIKSKSDEKLYEYISDGAPDDGMPAFKGKLTEAEIKSIIKHVRKLQGGLVLIR